MNADGVIEITKEATYYNVWPINEIDYYSIEINTMQYIKGIHMYPIFHQSNISLFHFFLKNNLFL